MRRTTWAVLYDEGRGVLQNDAEAVRLYRLAAEQDYTRAQYNLGVMYAQGLGVPRNGVEAVRWYRKVALKGLAQAQYNMGVRHAQGQGAPMDFIAGYAWMDLAAGQGLESAIEYREVLEARMTPRELVEAEKLSVELDGRVEW